MKRQKPYQGPSHSTITALTKEIKGLKLALRKKTPPKIRIRNTIANRLSAAHITRPMINFLASARDKDKKLLGLGRTGCAQP